MANKHINKQFDYGRDHRLIDTSMYSILLSVMSVQINTNKSCENYVMKSIKYLNKSMNQK